MTKQKYTDDFFIKEVQKYYKDHGKSPSRRTFKWGSAGSKRFGSWNNLLEAAGLETNEIGSPIQYPEDFFINEVKKFYKKTGEYPSTTNFEWQVAAIFRHGSWENLLKKANIPLKKRHSKEELIELARNHYTKYGESPTSKNFEQISEVTKYFETWSDFLIQSNLPLNREARKKKYTKQFFINEVQMYYEEHGKSPSSKSFNWGTTASRRFGGSWRNLLIKAGIPVTRPRKIQNSRVKNIRNRKFGRLTTKTIAYTQKGNAYWNCVCECGNKKIVSAINLKNGNVKSCGCLARETSIKYARKNLHNEASQKKATEHFLEKNMVDGVLVPALKRKRAKNNTSGVKGVSFNKSRNKWIASISIDGKQIQLGRFDQLEDAVEARKRAENKYYKPILDKAKKNIDSKIN